MNETYEKRKKKRAIDYAIRQTPEIAGRGLWELVTGKRGAAFRSVIENLIYHYEHYMTCMYRFDSGLTPEHEDDPARES